jgi:hypothetical protein
MVQIEFSGMAKSVEKYMMRENDPYFMFLITGREPKGTSCCCWGQNLWSRVLASCKGPTCDQGEASGANEICGNMHGKVLPAQIRPTQDE